LCRERGRIRDDGRQDGGIPPGCVAVVPPGSSVASHVAVAPLDIDVAPLDIDVAPLDADADVAPLDVDADVALLDVDADADVVSLRSMPMPMPMSLCSMFHWMWIRYIPVDRALLISAELTEPPKGQVAGLADSQSQGALPYRSRRSHGSVVPRLWVPASEVTRVVRANKGSSFRNIGSNAGCSGEQRQ
jgi:hypothetical protein